MSMRDVGILDGDLVAVHRTPEVRNRQIVVARLENEVTVKRYRQEGTVVWLLPENDDFEPLRVDLAQAVADHRGRGGRRRAARSHGRYAVSDALAELLCHPALWRGGGASTPETVPTGFRTLDARLPGGGWPLSTLIELLVPAAGVGEIRLLLPALRTLAKADGGEPRWIAWLAPPHLPYAPALADAGLDPCAHAGYPSARRARQALGDGAGPEVWRLRSGARLDRHRKRSGAASAEARGGRGPHTGLPVAAFHPSRRLLAGRTPARARCADDGLDAEILKCQGGGPARIERLPIH